MNSISSSCLATPHCWHNAAMKKSYHAMQFARIAAHNQESKDITIFTDEGDKVSISYNQQAQASYANLKALAYYTDSATGENQAVAKETLTRIQGEVLHFGDSRNLMITVDGDLNEQELADVKKAIEEIDEIMTDLLQGGDIIDAMAEAAEIRDLATIASLEADYRYEKTLLMENVAFKASEIYSRYGRPDGIETGKYGRKMDPFMKLIDKMTKIVENSNVNPSKFLKPVKWLFANIMHELQEDITGNKARRHVADLIGAELIKRIKQLADGENSGETT